MNLHNLEEADLLSMTLDQAHRYFSMVVCTADGRKYRLAAWNDDGAGLGATFGALHLRGNLTNSENLGVLGELEGISLAEGVLALEGDFGDIVIEAVTVSIEGLI